MLRFDPISDTSGFYSVHQFNLPAVDCSAENLPPSSSGLMNDGPLATSVCSFDCIFCSYHTLKWLSECTFSLWVSVVWCTKATQQNSNAVPYEWVWNVKQCEILICTWELAEECFCSLSLSLSVWSPGHWFDCTKDEIGFLWTFVKDESADILTVKLAFLKGKKKVRSP